jgi:hypothetical protein
VKPTIHVEGTDGSGKSTLVPILAKGLSCEVVPSEGPAKSWDDCLIRVGKRLRPGIVCDRSSGLVSELVYGPVLRGGCITQEDRMWDVVKILIVHGVKFVYCRPPATRIKPEFFDDEAPEVVAGVKAKEAELLARYDDVMVTIEQIGGTIVRYDWTIDTVEDLIQCVA